MVVSKSIRIVVLGLAFMLVGGAAATLRNDPVTPKEHQRGTEQTFLTFPEWYLVHSPAEYAAFVAQHQPDEFPFWGHIGQFWSSYNSVHQASKTGYPFNFGYHVMIMVIGGSTTVEYALRSTYETLIGRLSGLTRAHDLTAEDQLGAVVAQEYVDFIRVLPWYEFDFVKPLKTLWSGVDYNGSDLIRKWERRYALTTEYGIKAIYAWLIKQATGAAYDPALLVTAILIDRLPDGLEKELPDFKVLRHQPNGFVLALVPRYEAFKVYASTLARQGVQFREIAGNSGVILVSALVPREWQAGANDKILFVQPVITRPAEKRVALVTEVAQLAELLTRLNAPGSKLEHIYDY